MGSRRVGAAGGVISAIIAIALCSATPSWGQEKPKAVAPAREGPVVALTETGLTVKVEKVKLSQLLDKISLLGKVAIIRGDGVGEQETSVHLQNIPLDEALRTIVKEYDSFFFYGVERDAPAALRVIWVYPKGEARGYAPIHPAKWASTREFEEQLNDPDSKRRLRAIQVVVDRKGQQALDAILEGLKDGDEAVRTQALWAAQNAGVELPSGVLMGLALGDPSPEVRFLALEALQDHPDVELIAQKLAEDSSPHVQDLARAILDRLEQERPGSKAKPSPQSQPRP